MQNKEKLKNTLLILLIVALFICALIFAGRNVVTFIFGSTVELSPKKIYYSAAEDSGWYDHTITYNNGQKLVHQSIRLSIFETGHLRKNDGFMNFRKLNGYVTHRSAFVRSSILLIISALIIGFIVYNLLQGKKEMQEQREILNQKEIQNQRRHIDASESDILS